MWLEERICGPSVDLKQIAHVSFFECLCSFLMIWRIIFFSPLMCIIRLFIASEIRQELGERQILVIKDSGTLGNVLSAGGSWGQPSFLNALVQEGLEGEENTVIKQE